MNTYPIFSFFFRSDGCEIIQVWHEHREAFTIQNNRTGELGPEPEPVGAGCFWLMGPEPLEKKNEEPEPLGKKSGAGAA